MSTAIHIPLKQHYDRSRTFKSSLLLFVLWIAFTACDTPSDNKNEKKAYYDLKGFVENQIVYLNEKKARVSKSVSLNGEKEVQAGLQVDWKKELELFAQADINKPAYNRSYNVIRNDSSVYEYKMKEGEKLPVRYLMIKVDSATQQPLQVKAIIRSENKIFNAERNIELNTIRKNNLLEVTSYSIKGYQKLVLTDVKSFEITAKIGL
jgi:hypothetical protein